jgi:hypothetical protein
MITSTKAVLLSLLAISRLWGQTAPSPKLYIYYLIPGSSAYVWKSVAVDPPLLLTVDNLGQAHLGITLPPVSNPNPVAIDPGPAVVQTNAQTLTICPDCSVATPHKASVAGIVYTWVVPATITLALTATTDLRVYVSDGMDAQPPGTWVVASSVPTGVTCSPQCTVIQSTQFVGLALSQYHAEFSYLGPVLPPTLMDMRAYLSAP